MAPLADCKRNSSALSVAGMRFVRPLLEMLIVVLRAYPTRIVATLAVAVPVLAVRRLSRRLRRRRPPRPEDGTFAEKVQPDVVEAARGGDRHPSPFAHR